MSSKFGLSQDTDQPCGEVGALCKSTLCYIVLCFPHHFELDDGAVASIKAAISGHLLKLVTTIAIATGSYHLSRVFGNRGSGSGIGGAYCDQPEVMDMLLFSFIELQSAAG